MCIQHWGPESCSYTVYTQHWSPESCSDTVFTQHWGPESCSDIVGVYTQHWGPESCSDTMGVYTQHWGPASCSDTVYTQHWSPASCSDYRVHTALGALNRILILCTHSTGGPKSCSDIRCAHGTNAYVRKIKFEKCISISINLHKKEKNSKKQFHKKSVLEKSWLFNHFQVYLASFF